MRVTSVGPIDTSHTCQLRLRLWPRLTGAEILDLLANVGLGVDTAYRDESVDRDFGRLFPYIC